ncbi:hypothetical protein BDZ85DRAFT_252930 [Elsinoe ampelina]|uniref:DUF7907 domain-containing protein n=1 Tax=Elsinoe ampelina TaxID=302913 RepID=A0A6A6G0J9_9PEZI|nr:hypothetical protein BDZ85DRAFT_252930 [Elsinoe ampelina]
MSPATAAPTNTTREFQLVTKVKPGQRAAAKAFNKMPVFISLGGTYGYDLQVVAPKYKVPKQFFRLDPRGPGLTANKGQPLNVMVAIPNETGRLEYNVTVSLDSSYSDWSPMRANASATSLAQGSFLFDGNGLQLWRGSDTGAYSRGWLVCNWAKSSPQLFARLQANEGAERPSSCADVWLMPKYV